MPVHVDIRVNERIEQQIHIGRIDDLYSTDQVSLYVAIVGRYEDHNVPYETQGVIFHHRYSDGLEVCVQRGLEALIASGELD